MAFIDVIKARAKEDKKTIVLPESMDKRTFEAASAYKSKKVAVLNFANNHFVGGAPFSAGAQEESLCRTSTLYPCLLHEQESFYEKHKQMYKDGELDEFGNDDLIYSPDVIVFKTDESAPRMMEPKKWFKVDVITSAAPEFSGSSLDEYDWGTKYGYSRLQKVFQIAKKHGVEVLILGAWGCGAFGNPPTAVATTFNILCAEYRFDTIEFAIDCSRGRSENYEVFERVLKNRYKHDIDLPIKETSKEPVHSVAIKGYGDYFCKSHYEDDLFISSDSIKFTRNGNGLLEETEEPVIGWNFDEAGRASFSFETSKESKFLLELMQEIKREVENPKCSVKCLDGPGYSIMINGVEHTYSGEMSMNGMEKISKKIKKLFPPFVNTPEYLD